jgi:hypothetical protein
MVLRVTRKAWTRIDRLSRRVLALRKMRADVGDLSTSSGIAAARRSPDPTIAEAFGEFQRLVVSIGRYLDDLFVFAHRRGGSVAVSERPAELWSAACGRAAGTQPRRLDRVRAGADIAREVATGRFVRSAALQRAATGFTSDITFGLDLAAAAWEGTV